MTAHDPDTDRWAGPQAALVGPVPAPGIHIMSWNIRRPVPAALTRPADRWARRAPRLRALLATEQPTVLCAQEVAGGQIAAVLDGLGHGYDRIGRGRGADGGGEACPIFYDSTRLELLGWKQSALSDEPGRPGSVSWGNLVPRIVVTGTFRDRATARELLVVNTHFDPFSARSRLRSARAVLDLVAASGLPTVVAGDVNAGSSSAAVRELLASGLLTDGWMSAESRLTEQWGTFANYREPRRSGSRIDRIFTSAQVEVVNAAINPRRHGGGWASDHLPVQAVVRPDAARDDATRHAGGNGER